MNGIISSLVIIINAIFVNNIVMATVFRVLSVLGRFQKAGYSGFHGACSYFCHGVIQRNYLHHSILLAGAATYRIYANRSFHPGNCFTGAVCGNGNTKNVAGIVQCAWHLSAADYNKLRGIGLSHFEYSRGL